MNWFAQTQGREVFAVPGKLDSATSTGVNNLIKQGAKLVTSVDDVISELAPRLKGLINQSKESETEKAPDVNLGLNKDEALLYNFINARAKHIDELIREVNLPAPTVMSVLMNLELRHVVKQLPGKLFVRNYAKIV